MAEPQQQQQPKHPKWETLKSKHATARKASDAFRFVNSRANIFSDAYAKRKAGFAAEATGEAIGNALGARKGEVSASGEAVAQPQALRGASKSEGETYADYFTRFNDRLVEVIRRGHSRDPGTAAQEPEMLEAICNSDFIKALSYTTTPGEHMDSKYADSMGDVRKKLILKLMTRDISELTAQEQDLIYATIFSNAIEHHERDSLVDDVVREHAKETERRGKVARIKGAGEELRETFDSKGRKREKEEAKLREAAAHANAPEALARAREAQERARNAFFHFLESTAQVEYPGNEDKCIGGVLSELAKKSTIETDTQIKPRARLVDATYLDNYLNSGSAREIEGAVIDFQNLLREALVTPATELHRALETPGLGLAVAATIAKERFDAAVAAEAAALAKCTQGSMPNEAYAEYVKTPAYAANYKAYHEAAGKTEAAGKALANEVPGLDTLKNDSAKTAAVRAKLTAEARDVRTFNDATRMLGGEFKLQLIAGSDAKTMGEKLKNMRVAQNGLLLGLIAEAEKLNSDTALEAFKKTVMDKDAAEVAKNSAKADDAKQAAAAYTFAEARMKVAEMSVDRKALQQKTEALAAAITAAQMTAPLKEELCGIVRGIAKDNIPKESIDERLKGVRNRNAYPAAKAASMVMERLDKKEYLDGSGIPHARFVAARVLYEAQQKRTPKSEVVHDNASDRFKNKLRNGLALMSPLNAAAAAWDITYNWIPMPFRLKTVREHWRHRRDWVHKTLKDDTPDLDKPIMRRGFLAAMEAAAIVFTLGQLGSATLQTIHSAHGAIGRGLSAQFLGWPFREGSGFLFVRFPLANPFPYKTHDWQWPVSYLNPVHLQYENASLVTDDFNIPERLAKRGDAYYQSAYGAGMSNDGKDKERLAWLRAHDGVLRFMQERVAGFKVTGWTKLDMASTPPTLENVRTERRARKIKDPRSGAERDTTEIAQVADTVWKLVKLDTSAIKDGMVLNRHKTDEFIDFLRATEARHKGWKMDYNFVQNDRLAWEDRGYLVTKEKLGVMQRFGIKDNGNANFVIAQSLGDSLGPLGLRAKPGISTEYIEKPDAFIRAWRGCVVKLGYDDPAVAAVPQAVIRQAFDSTRIAEWGNSIRSAKAEFEEAQIRRKLGVDLADTTWSLLRANEDVGRLLMQFGGTSGYYLNPGRIDDFVQRVVDHKQAAKGDTAAVDGFNPSLHGTLVRSLITEGYIITSLPQEAVQHSAAPAAVPVRGAASVGLSADAAAFYGGKNAAPVVALLKSLKLGANKRAEQKAYEMLVSGDDPAVRARNQGRITASGTGAGMTVTVVNRDLAKRFLNAYLQSGL